MDGARSYRLGRELVDYLDIIIVPVATTPEEPELICCCN